MEPKHLGSRIREIRLEQDLSVTKVAKQAGISSPHLSDIELGRRYPSPQVLKSIARELQVSDTYLSEYDQRPAIRNFKELAERDAKWSLALRTMSQRINDDTLTADVILDLLDATDAD